MFRSGCLVCTHAISMDLTYFNSIKRLIFLMEIVQKATFFLGSLFLSHTLSLSVALSHSLSQSQIAKKTRLFRVNVSECEWNRHQTHHIEMLFFSKCAFWAQPVSVYISFTLFSVRKRCNHLLFPIKRAENRLLAEHCDARQTSDSNANRRKS